MSKQNIDYPALYQEYLKSGLNNKSEFARRKGLSVKNISARFRKLEEGKTGFAKIKLPTVDSALPKDIFKTSSLEIRIGKAAIAVNESTDRKLLADICQLLATLC